MDKIVDAIKEAGSCDPMRVLTLCLCNDLHAHTGPAFCVLDRFDRLGLAAMNAPFLNQQTMQPKTWATLSRRRCTSLTTSHP